SYRRRPAAATPVSQPGRSRRTALGKLRIATGVVAIASTIAIAAPPMLVFDCGKQIFFAVPWLAHLSSPWGFIDLASSLAAPIAALAVLAHRLPRAAIAASVIAAVSIFCVQLALTASPPISTRHGMPLAASCVVRWCQATFAPRAWFISRRNSYAPWDSGWP